MKIKFVKIVISILKITFANIQKTNLTLKMRLLNKAANILGSSALQNELFNTSCKKPRKKIK